MKEIKIYLDLEKIEEETKRTFSCENEYSDNFLQWVEFLSHCLVDTYPQNRIAIELYNILKNCYSEYDMRKGNIK